MPTVTLKNPVVLPDGRQFAVMTIEAVTLGGLAAHEVALEQTASENMALIAALTQESGWPREAVMKIRQSDLKAVGELFRPFESSEDGGPSGDPSLPTSPTS